MAITVTTRAVKGLALTYAEMDANLNALKGGVTNAAEIVGGAINGATVGAVTPGTGKFTTLKSTLGLQVAEGANAKQGVATLVAGSVVVANTSVTALSRIFLTGQADGGAVGFPRVSARVVGVSFTITSSSGTDTSIVGYQIFEPA